MKSHYICMFINWATLFKVLFTIMWTWEIWQYVCIYTYSCMLQESRDMPHVYRDKYLYRARQCVHIVLCLYAYSYICVCARVENFFFSYTHTHGGVSRVQQQPLEKFLRCFQGFLRGQKREKGRKLTIWGGGGQNVTSTSSTCWWIQTEWFHLHPLHR